MLKRMITKGNDSTLVYNTKLDLRMIYMACPWAKTVYHICDEHLKEAFTLTQDYVRPFAMSEGGDYILWDADKFYGGNSYHHYYFRKKQREKAVDTSLQAWHKIIQEEKERRCC